VKALTTNCSDQAKRIEESYTAYVNLTKELDVVKSRLGQNLQDYDIARSTIHSLEQQLLETDNLRSRADRVSGLERDIEAGNMAIRDLQQELSALTILNQDLEGHHIDAVTKAMEITELHTRLKIAEEGSQQLGFLQEELYKYKKEIGPLKTAHDRVNLLEAELYQKNAEIAGLDTKVADLSEKVTVQDTEISDLRVRLAEAEAEAIPEAVPAMRAPDDESFLNENFIHETRRLAEDASVQLGLVGHDNRPLTIENEGTNDVGVELESKKNRKRADRSTNYLEASISPPGGQNTVRESSNCAKVGLSQDKDSKGARCTPEHLLGETNVIPESQPAVNDPRQSYATAGKQRKYTGKIISSSPLSDVGDLFHSSDPEQPEKSKYYASPTHHRKRKGALVNDVDAAPRQTLGREDLDVSEYSQRSNSSTGAPSPQKPDQGTQLPSSSYGEPLLLDDFEGLGSLQEKKPREAVSEKQSDSSGEDLLTSPLSPRPRKAPRNGGHGRPNATSLSRTDMKAAGILQYGRHLVKDPSPRRLRSSEPTSQTNARQPLQDFGDNATNIRPATPNLAVKEKHQPNSAIKRTSEAADIVDETVPKEKKRAKRNLSNLEVAKRPGRSSSSLSSSTSGKVGQTSTRIRQSSIPTTSSRSTIMGKNAPAPGGVKQGSKRPRGGSKSEDWQIITISRDY
jgi:predicted  nucleic acid-binding Zn-ribbon protein